MRRKFIKKPILAAFGVLRTKRFNIQDIDSNMIVEECTRKELLSWLDEYIDNTKYD